MAKKDFIEDSAKLLRGQLRDLSERVGEALKMQNTDLAESFAVQCERLLSAAVLTWNVPGCGLVPLMAEFKTLGPRYLIGNQKMKILEYVNDSIHRCIVIVDQLAEHSEDRDGARTIPAKSLEQAIPKSNIQNTISDLEVLVEKCRRDIADKFYWSTIHYGHEFNRILAQLKQIYPTDFEDVHDVIIDSASRGEISRGSASANATSYLHRIDAEASKVHRRILSKATHVEVTPVPKAFISHGTKTEALDKIEKFLRSVGVEPLIVVERPSLDKNVDSKVNFYLNQSDFVVVLGTADDEIDGKMYPRQNVAHEVGLAQKTHEGKIIYLLQVGAEFPSNIKPRAYEPFNPDKMENVFLYIAKELVELGVLRAFSIASKA